MFDIRELSDLKLEYKSSLNLPSNILFGIEIEFLKTRLGLLIETLEKEKIVWKVREENDTSKNANIPNEELNNVKTPEEYRELEFKYLLGGEITSPILSDVKTTWKDLKKCLEIIRSNDGEVNDMCALQLNYSSSILGNDYRAWLNFFKLYTVYEPVIFNFTSGAFDKTRKQAYLRAYPIRNHYRAFFKKKNLINFKESKDLISIFKMHPKTSSLSVDKISTLRHVEGSVIEFRSPNGTLNEEIVQNTFNFFSYFLLYCKNTDFDGEFVNYKLKHMKEIKNFKNAYTKLWEREALELLDLIYKNDSDKLDFLLQFYKINLPKDGIIRKK